LNHPVCSNCQYFMSGSKLLDGINLYIQLVCSSCLVENLDGITMYVLYVWFKTFRCNLPLCSICQYFMSDSKLLDWITPYVQLVSTSLSGWKLLGGINLYVLHVYFKTWIESPCMFFMSGSKLLDRITLYVQLVSTSCLVQNFWIEPPCMFNLSVFHVWFKTWMESPCMFNLSVLHVWFKTFG
jgi:hypothetical protein